MPRLVFALVAAMTVMVASILPAAANKPAGQAQGDRPMVVFSTNHGDFTVELYPDKAPITVKNFLAYVDAGHFDGTIFHRVIPGFVIQGGGFTPDMRQKPTQAPIKNEADNGLKNLRGTLSMARTADINSATSQFFVNLKDNDFLDHGVRDFGYAVFGKVVEGMDVIDKIAQVPTTTRGMHRDVPVEPVVVNSAKRKES
jgi:peptidyl-prolyl cis-trans isomerase A (cyclophilin A)